MKIPRGIAPPDADNFHPRDFESPRESFYWLGYYASKASREAAKPKKPLCELADFVVFDTETSGLSSEDVAVQVAVGFFRKDGHALGFYDKLWKLPKGTRISKGSYRIHKISELRLGSEGLEAAPQVRAVLKIMRRTRARGKPIIAHNAAFDCRILTQTARRHGVEEWDIQREDLFCTMQAAKSHCSLRSPRTGKPKAPSNTELFKKLLGSYPTGSLHDAVVDVRVTAKSYTEGAKRGWW